MLLVLGVNAVAALVPFTPGGAGVQQALLVKVFGSGATVAAYSVGQQIAIAALTFGLGLASVVWIFKFRSFKEVIRAGAGAAGSGEGRHVKLAATEPFDGASLLAFLAARAVPGVEEVVGDTYRRSLPDGSVADVTVHADGIETDNPAVAAVFDLDAPAAEIADVLGRDPLLRFTPGRRVPGVVDGYELAIRAVLGQQISIQAAATHAARLVAVAGEPVAEPRGTVTHVFPTAEAIAAAPDSAFAMPVRRRETLRSLAGRRSTS